jgi:PAS domain S-box-containing protein
MTARENIEAELVLEVEHRSAAFRDALEALRASEARLKFVLEAANLGAWDFDLASREAWRSAEHDAIFGYPAPLREWTYEMFLDHVVPEDRAEVGRMAQQAITGADLEYECRIRTAGGALRWIWVKGRPQRDPEGRPRRPTGIIGDITPRKKMEEDLRQSGEQFRTLANAIPQLCGMANADGSFFWINQRWFDFTGLTPEQSKGRRWMSALDPENSREALERWRHSVATGEPFESVFGVRGADDAFHPFLGAAVPLRNRDGRVVRWFGTMTDITEQRKTEDALRKSHHEEMARARELEAIMEAMPVAVFLSRDSECRNIMGNRAAYELLRRPPASNLSKSAPEGERPDTFRFVRSGKEIPVSELPIQQAAATGHRIQDYEMDAVFEDGTARSLIGIAVPLLDAEGFPRGAVAVFGDITERKRTEERLRQVQKLESIGVLAGGVAHDFNNLLTVIMGNADAALRQYPSCEELQRIISASEEAAHLTRQLLAYAGKGRFLSETFDLSDLVTRSTHLLSASIPKRMELLFHLSPQPVLVDADHSQIEQILLNLVINAGEAIPSNSVGRIEIATNPCDIAPEMNDARASAFDVRPGPSVCLEVKDNGSGMDEATLAHIFDPFFTTKFMGRGLGLAAVQGIVRSYNGYIEVHSSPGAGSTFRIFLPASAKQLDAVAPPAPRPRALPRRRSPRGAILIVEDEEQVRGLVSTELRSRGYEVLEAGNGRDALDVLARAARPPALVLLDLTMPVMGGEELVPILNRDYPDLPILLTSGYPEEEAQRAFPPGAVAAFLQKPYTVAALAEKVERTLDRVGAGNSE